MTTALLLRLADESDAPRIADMSRDLIEQGLGWSWRGHRVLRCIRDADINVLVASFHGRTVGFAIMSYRDEEAHLLLFAVDPRFGRRGIGSALLRWLEQSALVAGIGQVYLESRVTNAAARAFYKLHGYREVQLVQHYYQGVEASVRLAKDLWLERPAAA